MQEIETLFPQDLYLKHLTVLGNIHFTSREIDVMSCIVSARRTSKIGSFLSINPRTVETHIRNIMLKLECNSQEGIIDFIESSDKLSFFKKYYALLRMQIKFEKSLTLISKLNREKGSLYFLIQGEVKDFFISHLTDHLKLAGIRLSSTKRKRKEDETIVIIPRTLKAVEVSSFLENIKHEPNKTLVILQERKNNKEICENLKGYQVIDFGKQEAYYFSFFSLLKKLIPNFNFDEIVSEFEVKYKTISMDLKLPNNSLNKSVSEDSLRHPFIHGIRLWAVLFVMILLGLGFSGLQWYQKRNSNTAVRSDLILPGKSVFLNRPDLLQKLEKKLKGEGIQTVALVGDGGAGKTTLARSYAHQKKGDSVWEINAETHETLNISFEQLAHALSKTEEDQKALKNIQEIKDPIEKENEVIHFVKEHLRAQSNWLLLYDNVVTFSDIQKYFPFDFDTWGCGTVILTTRDGNIGSNKHIDHVIFIGELSPQEKLTLFTKIMAHDKTHLLTASSIEDAKLFLEKIPSFPLDVSIAAYYLKATNISYSTYLENLERLDKDFTRVQEDILREAGEYSKIRYRIITSSLSKILEEHNECKELLLFIMLLDSQKIPRNLLENVKDDVLVSDMIFNLKKYSLLTCEFLKSTVSNSSISIHRSTQSIGLSYLLQKLNLEKDEDLIKPMAKKMKDYYERYKKENHKIIPLIPHLESLLKNLKIVNMPSNIKEKYKIEFLLMLAYAHYKHTQDLVLAKKIFIQIVNNNLEGEKIPNYIFSNVLKDLGSICFMLGDFDESISYCQKSINSFEKLPNSELLIAENLEMMGASYNRKNNFNLSKQHFEKALNTISKLPLENRQERELEIYMRLSLLYGSTYLGKYKIYEMEKYALNSALIIKNLEALYKDSQKKLGVSCESILTLARSLSNLGFIYSTLGKYEEAMEKQREAQNIISSSNKKNGCSHVLLKSFISLDIAEILLREGKLEAADNELKLYIDTITKLLGEYSSLRWKIYRAEARIRLRKFADAYEDCLDVFRLQREDDYNCRKIGYLTCLYHAAIIKYNQEDLEKSLEHFSDFFKKMQIFCKQFLKEKDYKELESKNVFADIDLTKTHPKSAIKQYLARSTQIFISIYGSEHLFVKDYVMKNELEGG